jgi:hypothetical protein
VASGDDADDWDALSSNNQVDGDVQLAHGHQVSGSMRLTHGHQVSGVSQVGDSGQVDHCVQIDSDSVVPAGSEHLNYVFQPSAFGKEYMDSLNRQSGLHVVTKATIVKAYQENGDHGLFA